MRASPLAPLTIACAFVACTAPPAPLEPGRAGPALVARSEGAAPELQLGRRLAFTGRHGCVLDRRGGVWCWGHNESGQAGPDVEPVLWSARRLPGLPAMRTIAAGDVGTCAVSTEGELWCWGKQLDAKGRWASLRAPQKMPGLSGVADVAVGAWRRCATLTTGELWCWGEGGAAIGRSDDREAHRPGRVEGLPAIRSAVVSDDRTCALDTRGSAWCVGGGRCVAGDESKVPPRTEAADGPQRVEGLDGLVGLAIDDGRLCGVDPEGAVRCAVCGGARSNAAEDGAPLDLGVLAPARHLSFTSTSACVVRLDGTTVCAGEPPSSRFEWPRRRRVVAPPGPPRDVGLESALEVVVHETSVCALGHSGGVWCWGHDAAGELGHGAAPWLATARDATPAVGPGLSGIAATDRSTCVIQSDGRVLCFGDEPTPPHDGLVPELFGVERLVGGPGEVCASVGRVVRCWSRVGKDLPPVAFDGPERLVVIGEGARCVVDEVEGRPHCVAKAADASLTERLERLRGVRALAVGAAHACATVADGRVRCTGENEHGQLGRAGAPTSAWVEVVGPREVKELVAGATTTCALEASGALWCWGADASVGESTTLRLRSPVRLLEGVERFAMGARHGCAVLRDGALRCWGTDLRGQLGDGAELAYRFEPVAVELAARPTALALGKDHSCVLDERGVTRCWGSNEWGQLGSSVPLGRVTSPTFVVGLPRY